MKGQVVYLIAYDIGHEVISANVGRILDQQPARLDIRSDHTSPRDVPLHQPLAVELPSRLSASTTPVRVQVRIYDVGVVSIALRVDLDVESVDAMRPFHQMTFDDGRSIDAAARSLCDRVISDLGSAVVKPTRSTIPEAYTVFVLKDLGSAVDVPGWLSEQATQVAGLLSDVVPERLSTSQVAEILRHQQSFEKTDLVVVDWDAALVVDLTGDVEDVLFVLELANLQLEEFRVMDAALDRQLAKSYGLMEELPRFLIARPSAGLRQLREMSVDLARLADEVTHITKFFGDWYLARVYLIARERFHLEEWRASVAQRLRQLNDLYSVVRAEVNERRMLWLEAIIVLFFAIDLLAIFFLRR